MGQEEQICAEEQEMFENKSNFPAVACPQLVLFLNS